MDAKDHTATFEQLHNRSARYRNCEEPIEFLQEFNENKGDPPRGEEILANRCVVYHLVILEVYEAVLDS